MTKVKEQHLLKNNEIALLGLLAEKSRYGYELDKVIEERGMRQWTDIAFSSIYAALRQLENQKLVGSKTEVKGNRIRRHYLITAKGRRYLAESVETLLSTPVKRAYELDLGIANILALSPQVAKEQLLKREEALKNAIAYLKKMKRARIPKGTPYFIEALFDRPLIYMRAELKFIKEFINRQSKGGVSK